MPRAIRALITSAVFGVLFLWAAPVSSVIVGGSMLGGSLSAKPPTSERIAALEASFALRRSYAPWADCDFGGALPTPVLAYNFNSVDRTVLYLGSPLTNYHSSSSEAASISPTANHEIHCNTAYAAPYCGTYNATGGPDGSGHAGSAYYDLSSGSGTVHRGLIKAVDAAEEDYSGNNEMTISLFVKLDGKSSPGTTIAYKTLEFGFTGGPVYPGDSHLCVDTTADTSSNCGYGTATPMLAWEANGVWTHYAYVYDGPTSHKIYRDGVLAFERAGTSSTIGNSGYTLAVGAVNTWGFDGSLDEFSIFDEALDASDVMALSTCVVPE